MYDPHDIHTYQPKLEPRHPEWSKKTAGQRLRGEPFSGATSNPRMAYASEWKGVVMSVDVQRCTCSVYTEYGEYLHDTKFADHNERIPKRGDTVFVTTLGKQATLIPGPPEEVQIGRNVIEGSVGAFGQSLSMTPVDEKQGFVPDDDGPSKRGSLPEGTQPGDRVFYHEDGQILGMLTGGSVLLKASDLAQIIMTQARNLVRVVGQNFRLDTGAGSIDFRTEGGKSTLDVKIGADESTESSVRAENWRIRAELGQDGEMIDVRVTDAKGRSLWRHHVDPDGRVNSKMTRRTEIIEEDVRMRCGSNYVCESGESIFVSAQDAYTCQVGTNMNCSAEGNVSILGSSGVDVQSGRDLNLGAARNGQFLFGGDATSAAAALEMLITNGDLDINVGNPLQGSLPGQGINLNTYLGNMTLNARSGKINLNSLRPNGVGLGGPTNIKPFHPVIFEFFKATMTVLLGWLDTHTHTVAGIIPTTPPVLPSTPVVQATLPLCKSRMVSLGG